MTITDSSARSAGLNGERSADDEIADLENELASQPYPDYDDIERLEELKRERIYRDMQLSTL